MFVDDDLEQDKRESNDDRRAAYNLIDGLL
jgi:hypothetical protein